jgi:hypothetical protein
LLVRKFNIVEPTDEEILANYFKTITLSYWIIICTSIHEINQSIKKKKIPMVLQYNMCVSPLITLHYFCWYYVLVILLPTATARKFGKNQSPGSQTRIARNISVKDVIAVLEREPQMSKSSLLYRLHERIHSDTSTE